MESFLYCLGSSAENAGSNLQYTLILTLLIQSLHVLRDCSIILADIFVYSYVTMYVCICLLQTPCAYCGLSVDQFELRMYQKKLYSMGFKSLSGYLQKYRLA